jgi:hypothetical protein
VVTDGPTWWLDALVDTDIEYDEMKDDRIEDLFERADQLRKERKENP